MVGVCRSCFQSKSSSINENNTPHPLRDHQQAVNPRTGRLEVVFVDLAKVYPNRESPLSEEYSFEELRAQHRGWMARDWAAIRRQEQEQLRKEAEVARDAKQPFPKATPLAIRAEVAEASKPKASTKVYRDPADAALKPKTVPMVFKDVVEETPELRAAPMVFRDPIKEEPKSKSATAVFKDVISETPETEAVPAVFRDATEEAPKPRAASPMVFRDLVEQAPRPKTVPLKGGIGDDAANDENTPPSQVDIEKARAAKKARREERANRTRKIKVMDVKEIRGETQTGKC